MLDRMISITRRFSSSLGWASGMTSCSVGTAVGGGTSVAIAGGLCAGTGMGVNIGIGVGVGIGVGTEVAVRAGGVGSGEMWDDAVGGVGIGVATVSSARPAFGSRLPLG